MNNRVEEEARNGHCLNCAKHQIAAHALSVRRPKLFEQGQNIRLYVENFDVYRTVVGIAPEISFKIFLTYLPDRLRLKFRWLKLSKGETDNWQVMMDVIIDTLTLPAAKLEAKQ